MAAVKQGQSKETDETNKLQSDVPADTKGVDSGKVVVMTNPNYDEVEISRSAWDSIGSRSGLTRWNAKNGYSVDVSDLDDVALAYLDGQDHFVVKNKDV